MSLALGRARRGVRFGGTVPSSGHSTVVAMGGPWAWPNTGETQFLVFADSSWMLVGQTIRVDDGVHTPGVMQIVAIGTPETPGDPTVVECSWTVGPTGGTTMLDGAAVVLVT